MTRKEEGTFAAIIPQGVTKEGGETVVDMAIVTNKPQLVEVAAEVFSQESGIPVTLTRPDNSGQRRTSTSRSFGMGGENAWRRSKWVPEKDKPKQTPPPQGK